MQKQTVTQEKRAWRLQELSSAYGLSVALLRKEVRAGRLPVKRAGKAVLVLDEDFREYLNRNSDKAS
jgi:hypothetical protein